MVRSDAESVENYVFWYSGKDTGGAAGEQGMALGKEKTASFKESLMAVEIQSWAHKILLITSILSFLDKGY